MSVFCREPTFFFVLNYRLTTGTKKTGKKKTGKKARSSARSIGKQLYSSVSLVDRLAITSSLQSPSIVADMSAFSVRLDIYVCTILLANNREKENRDDRPSHFLVFLSCLAAAYDLLQDKYLNYRPNSQIFARRGRKAPLEYRRMIRAAICTYNIEVGVVSLDSAIPCGRDRQYRILFIQQCRVQTSAAHCYTNIPISDNFST